MGKVIVVGTDGSETALKALEQAAGFASTVGATLEIVSAYEPRSNQRQRNDQRDAPGDVQEGLGSDADVQGLLDEAKRQAHEFGAKDVNTSAREGDPAEAILKVAEDTGADMVVVGNKGMSGAKRFLLGSVPNKISHHAPCDVLIVKTS